jgi:hypothetical protein
VQSNPEIEQRVNAAMEKSNGDRGYAAVLLGMTVREVANAIASSAALSSRWDASSESEVGVDSEPTQPIPPEQSAGKEFTPAADPHVERIEPTKAELDAAVSFAKQDAMLRRGLGLIGLSPKEVILADGLAQFNRGFFADTLHMTTGGAARISIILQAEIDSVRAQMHECAQKLSDDQLYPVGSPTREALLAEQRDLREAMDRFTTNIRLLANQAMTAAFTQAAIHAKQNSTGTPRGKPGFTPMKSANSPQQ